MNERERQIAGRVRQVRYSNGLSQPRFAYALEISLHRLAGIEYGRTPLRVWIADMISVKFDVSLVWLAEGRGRMNPCDGLIFAICPEIKPGELLSRAWTSELKRAFRVNSLFREFCLQATLTGVAGLATGKNLERYILGFHHAIDESFQDLPHEGREKLLNVMVRALAGFAADWKLGAEDPGQSEHANSKKGLLTDSSQLCNRPSDMKSEMRKITLQKVLADVRLLVSARGMKARLAADLGVPRPRISGWMAGTRKPSGETALRLARWAELQGRKSK